MANYHETKLAPIILFAFDRPDHTRKTLDALSSCPLAGESKLFVYCDGPKADSTEIQNQRIYEVRKMVNEESRFESVQITERRENLGLGLSIISGVGEVVSQFGKVIVLEDDLVVEKGYLNYMNKCLDLYENSPNVYGVTGYMFPVQWEEEKVVLLPYASTLGWGTWRSRWECFSEEDPNTSLLEKHHLANRFNLADFDYVGMTKLKLRNSWGIRWYYSIFKRNGLFVFPTHSLVRNIGDDGSGTNQLSSKKYSEIMAQSIKIEEHNEIDLKFWIAYMDYFSKKQERTGFYSYAIHLAKRILEYFDRSKR